jgi:hypothetical protein
LDAATLTLAFGTTTNVLWEICEYLVMSLGSSGLHLTHEDTIGDLALSFCGSLAGALLTATLLWGRSNASLALFGPSCYGQPSKQPHHPSSR